MQTAHLKVGGLCHNILASRQWLDLSDLEALSKMVPDAGVSTTTVDSFARKARVVSQRLKSSHSSCHGHLLSAVLPLRPQNFEGFVQLAEERLDNLQRKIGELHGQLVEIVGEVCQVRFRQSKKRKKKTCISSRYFLKTGSTKRLPVARVNTDRVHTLCNGYELCTLPDEYRLYPV